MAESSPKLKLYLDNLSQPCRAINAFCLINKIPHEIKFVSLIANDHNKAEYEFINPFGKIPAINDDGFNLFESHAILRYLARTRKTPDHWYPADPKKVALIDAYLDWHHTGIRKATQFFFVKAKIEIPGLSYKSFNEEEVTKQFQLACDAMEKIWLKDEKFIGGASDISIADLSAFCELKQLLTIDYDFSAYPKIDAWMKKIWEIEEVKKVHETLIKFKEGKTAKVETV